MGNKEKEIPQLGYNISGCLGTGVENYETTAKSNKVYSEEEVIYFLQKYRLDLSSSKTAILGDTTNQWFEQFKKEKGL